MARNDEDLLLQEAWVRDCLAMERTIMANERTLLAYVRTALGFFIGGVSFLEFFESFYMEVVGWIFIPAGVVVFGLAIMRYRKIRELIKGAEKVCLFVPKPMRIDEASLERSFAKSRSSMMRRIW